MSKDVLAPYSSQGMPDNRASNGGQQSVKEIPYSKPTADVPMEKSPGLHGSNHGNNGTQGRH